jgi:hypothetical protein
MLDFVFPVCDQYARSSARLTLVGLYGPLKEGKLKGGKNLLRYLTDLEIDTMCTQIEREDIVNIYVKDHSKLSEGEQNDIIRQADFEFHPKGKARLPQISKTDFYDLISKYLIAAATHDTSRDGYISFHALQTVILRFRAKRINALKRKEPLRSKKDKIFTDPTLDTTFSSIELKLKDTVPALPLSSSRNLFRIVQKGETQSNDSLSANLKLLRPNQRDLMLNADPYLLEKEKNWDDTCFIKESTIPSMVNDKGRKAPNRKYTVY